MERGIFVSSKRGRGFLSLSVTCNLKEAFGGSSFGISRKIEIIWGLHWRPTSSVLFWVSSRWIRGEFSRKVIFHGETFGVETKTKRRELNK